MEDAVYQTYVKGIYCAQCPEWIISGMLQTRGVIDVDVAYFQSRVSVKYAPEIVSAEEIGAALEEMGYPPIERKPLLSEQIVTRLSHLLFGEV